MFNLQFCIDQRNNRNNKISENRHDKEKFVNNKPDVNYVYSLKIMGYITKHL